MRELRYELSYQCWRLKVWTRTNRGFAVMLVVSFVIGWLLGNRYL